MNKIAKLSLRALKCNCGARVNSLLLAAVPILDQLATTLPTLREHLPANVYGYAFVVLALVNVVLHVRANPPKLDS